MQAQLSSTSGLVIWCEKPQKITRSCKQFRVAVLGFQVIFWIPKAHEIVDMEFFSRICFPNYLDVYDLVMMLHIDSRFPEQRPMWRNNFSLVDSSTFSSNSVYESANHAMPIFKRFVFWLLARCVTRVAIFTIAFQTTVTILGTDFSEGCETVVQRLVSQHVSCWAFKAFRLLSNHRSVEFREIPHAIIILKRLLHNQSRLLSTTFLIWTRFPFDFTPSLKLINDSPFNRNRRVGQVNIHQTDAHHPR